MPDFTTTGLSVVMPTARSLDKVSGTLESIVPSISGPDEMIVVVNGDSQAAKTYEQSGYYKNPRVRIVHEPTIGLLCGRHRGLQLAKNELLVFVDDDIVVGPSWRSAISNVFQQHDVHLAGGPSRADVDLSSHDWIAPFIIDHQYGTWCPTLSLLDFGTERLEIDPCFVWGLNFSVRKASLLEVGGFHPDGVPWELRRYRGDGETAVSMAFSKRGWKAIYEPKAAVTHTIPESRLTIEYFARRAFLQGISDSYSKIRLNGCTDQELFRLQVASRPLWRRIAGRLKNFFKSSPPNELDPKKTKAEQSANDAYLAGYQYHQEEVANDPKLLNWVLRDNYLNYSYPEIDAP